MDLPVIRIVQYYKIHFENNSFLKKCKSENLKTDTYSFFKRPKKSVIFRNKLKIIFAEFICLFKLFINIVKFRNEIIICFGGHYSFMFATKIFGFILGKNYHLFIYNFYLHSLSKNCIVQFILKYLVKSKKITLIVQSPNEIKYFQKFSFNKVEFIPYSTSKDIIGSRKYSEAEKYIFSGGYSNRDYELLFQCIRINPSINFVVVVSALNQIIEDISPNVKIYKNINKEQFIELIEKSSGVIIPLKEDVGSSGQMVSLLAIKSFKPVIYCDISSINYYFKPYKSGIPYKMGDLNSLNEALKILLGTNNINRDSMVNEAFDVFITNFTLERRDEKLIQIIWDYYEKKNQKNKD